MTQPNRSPARRSSTARMLAVGLLAMLASACTMRTLIGLDVNADGSGVFEVTMAFDEELRTLLEEDSPEPIDWSDPEAFADGDSPTDLVDDLPEGASVSPYTEEDFEGFTVTVEFSSLEELDRILSETSDDSEDPFPFQIAEPEEGRFELTTHGQVLGDSAPAGDELEMVSESMLAQLFDMRLQVSLPGEVVSTNADETDDDGSMVWRIDPMSDDPTLPRAASQVTSSSVMPVLVVIAVLVIGAVAAAAVFLRGGNPAELADTAPADLPQGGEGTA